MFWTHDKGISCTFFCDVTAFRERSIKLNLKKFKNNFRVDCLFLASRVWYIFDSLKGESKDEPLGLIGLTVSTIAVVLYWLALLRLGVSIRLLHPGQKNPPPLPPMVIQNVEEDMGGEHTTERTGWSLYKQIHDQLICHLWQISNFTMLSLKKNSQPEIIHHSEQVFAIGFLITTCVPFLERSGPLSDRYSYFRNRS